MVFALWDRAKLAADSGVTDSGGWGGVTLAYNARSPAEVDAVIEQVEPAGERSCGRARETFWGGYSGAFCDPDGHPVGGRAQPALDDRGGRQRQRCRDACARATQTRGEQRRVVGELLLERALELRVDLADAALGHAEDLADLAQREVLDVEQHRDLALALRQHVERAAELVLGGLGRRRLLGVQARVGGGERVDPLDRRLVVGDHERVRAT